MARTPSLPTHLATAKTKHTLARMSAEQMVDMVANLDEDTINRFELAVQAKRQLIAPE